MLHQPNASAVKVQGNNFVLPVLYAKGVVGLGLIKLAITKEIKVLTNVSIKALISNHLGKDCEFCEGLGKRLISHCSTCSNQGIVVIRSLLCQCKNCDAKIAGGSIESYDP